MQNTYGYTLVISIEIYVHYIISKLCKIKHAYMPLSHPSEQEEPKGRFRSKMESWTLLPEGAREKERWINPNHQFLGSSR